MKAMLWLFASCAGILPVVVYSQVPQWEDPAQVFSNRSIESAFSNGYGQHLGVARTSNAKHYLVGNDGAIVFYSPDFGGTGQGVTAVSAFGAYVNVAYKVSIALHHDVIRLQRSNDGGAHWLMSAFQFDPADSFSNAQEIGSIHAYADVRGVHIVWESSTEVYYTLFDPDQGFRTAKQVTDLNPGTGILPKVITSPNKVHVSFVRTDVAPDAVATRDANFSSNGGISWETSYENVPVTQSSSYEVRQQSVARLGDTLHVVFFQERSGGNHPMQAAKRSVGSTSWSPSTSLYDWSHGSGLDGKNCLAALGDSLCLVYSPYVQAPRRIDYLTYKPESGWSSSFPLESGNAYAYSYPTISSSRTGVYFYWHHNSFSTAWMKRRVHPLGGHVTETMFFTGKNWITGDLTVDSGFTVTLKAGSTTYVSDNKKLIVANGGTLKKERGSQIVFGTGAKYQLNATLLNSWNMTGIPAVLPNFDTSAVYPTATSMVFSYNPNAGGYVVTNPLSNDRGFFVKFGYAQNHVYEGGYIDSIAMNAYNGWNIIGSISSPIDTAMVYSSPPGIVVLPYYKYTSTGYVPVTSLVPGAGYWVKTSSAGKIILNLRSQPGSPPAQQEDQLDTYDRFTITDANGAEQSLYVRNAVLAGTTEDLEMPPPPPGAEFDARFLSGDFLRTVNPDSGVVQLDIAVEAVALPVTLSWQVNPENAIQYSLGGGGLGKVSRSGEQSTIASSGSLPIASNGTIRLSGQPRLADRRGGLPLNFALHQSYPNPFNPTTNIAFDLPGDSRVDLVVLDLLGRQVALLVDGVRSAGRHNVTFDASTLASGVYFYRLQATALGGGYSLRDVKKLLLLR